MTTQRFCAKCLEFRTGILCSRCGCSTNEPKNNRVNITHYGLWFFPLAGAIAGDEFWISVDNLSSYQYVKNLLLTTTCDHPHARKQADVYWKYFLKVHDLDWFNNYQMISGDLGNREKWYAQYPLREKK